MAVSNITRARSTVVSSLSSFSTRRCNSLTRGWRGLCLLSQIPSERERENESEGDGLRGRDRGGGERGRVRGGGERERVRGGERGEGERGREGEGDNS